MNYKSWTTAELISNSKRLAELIPLAKKEMMEKGVRYRPEYISAIYRAEITLVELRKEYHDRTRNQR